MHAGWGKTKDNGDSSFVLLDVQLPVVVHERCIDMSAVSSNIFKDSNVCAGGEVGKDACQVRIIMCIYTRTSSFSRDVIFAQFR